MSDAGEVAAGRDGAGPEVGATPEPHRPDVWEGVITATLRAGDVDHARGLIRRALAGC